MQLPFSIPATSLPATLAKVWGIHLVSPNCRSFVPLPLPIPQGTLLASGSVSDIRIYWVKVSSFCAHPPDHKTEVRCPQSSIIKEVLLGIAPSRICMLQNLHGLPFTFYKLWLFSVKENWRWNWPQHLMGMSFLLFPVFQLFPSTLCGISIVIPTVLCLLWRIHSWNPPTKSMKGSERDSALQGCIREKQVGGSAVTPALLRVNKEIHCRIDQCRCTSGPHISSLLPQNFAKAISTVLPLFLIVGCNYSFS